MAFIYLALDFYIQISFFFSQYPDGAKVVNIPKKNLTLLTTLFQRTFKIACNRHKCGNTLIKEIVIFVAFRPPKKGIYNKTLCFEKNCVIFWQCFIQKE
jgi:hypothetical protein